MNEKMWKTVPFDGFADYEVSSDGDVRKKSNGFHPKQCIKTYHNTIKNDDLYVNLHGEKGNIKTQRVINLVAIMFLGMPEGCFAFPKDGNNRNITVGNIFWKTPEEAEEITGLKYYRRKRQVVKINRKGELLKTYESIREAAETECFDKYTIIRQCNGKAKKTLGEISFFYKDDEEGYRNSVERFNYKYKIAR